MAPTNLPVQLTSFIGREREIVDVKRLLSESRLVTLTGAGGSGKTRLALQVAVSTAGSFADGAWMVDLHFPWMKHVTRPGCLLEFLLKTEGNC